MQVTSLLSQQDEHQHGDGKDCASCGHDHEHASQQLGVTLFGLILVINSFIIEWFMPGAKSATAAATADIPIAAALSAGLGAIVLGWPIVVVAVKDLKRGNLTTNELVALAWVGRGDFAASEWEDALQLAQTRRVISFDLPGSGLTGPNAEGDYRLERYVAFARSLLARLGDLASGVYGLPLAFLPNVDGVDLRVTAHGLPADVADARLEAAAARLRASPC